MGRILSARAAFVVAGAIVGLSSIGLAAEPQKSIETQGNQAAVTAKPVEPAALPSEVDRIKQPVSWFKWGADFRWRQEYYNNAVTLSDDVDAPKDNEANYQRYRARAWYSILPTEDLAFNNRWTWEGRYYWEPTSRDGFDQNYIIADQLNVQIKNLGGDPKSVLTVGRQDINLFDGWLILDGTPLDGSKTLFFDAVRLQYQLNKESAIDVAALVTRTYVDKWSPVIMGDRNAVLTEQDEQGGYINYDYRPDKDTRLDPYFIYKHNEAQLPNGDNGDIYAFGGRAEHGFTNNVSGRIEGAYEFGQNDNIYTPSQGNLQAWGINSRATYAFKDQMDNKLSFSGEYLSGDRQGSETNEAFDVLWGRWPRFSELYSLTQSSETRVADYTNLYRFGPTWDVSPNQKLAFSTSYFALFADQLTYEGSPAFGNGYFRGHLFQAIMRYKFNRYLAGHLWGEYFIPGDYYGPNRQDDAVFLRAELAFTF